MKDESGNVLFFILIGVALYAALSFTITRSDTNSNLDAQTAYANANKIMQYGADVKQGVSRVRAQNGCAIEQVSFDPPPFDGSVYGGGYVNSNSPGDNRCHVFSSEGGNVTFKDPPSEWLDGVNTSSFGYGELFVTGNTCVAHVGSSPATGCNASSDGIDEDLILFIPYIQEEICQYIAKELGTVRPDGRIAVDGSSAWDNVYYTGSFADSRILLNNGGADGSLTLRGKASGCFEGGGGTPNYGTFHYYQVLEAR